jgi:hypothetical protein
MSLEKEFTLKPLVSGYSQAIAPVGKPYYEQVVIYEGDYPVAMVHGDLFWPGQRTDKPEELFAIHDAVYAGHNVKVKVTFTIIDEDN